MAGQQSRKGQRSGQPGLQAGVTEQNPLLQTNDGSPVPLLSESKRRTRRQRVEETADDPFERLEREIGAASGQRPSAEVLATRVTQLEEQITGLQADLRKRESVGNYSIELFIAVAAGALTAPLGALTVGESPSKELLKAVVAGAGGGMVVIVVFAARKVVKQIWIDYRKSRDDGCGDVSGCDRPADHNHSTSA